MFKSITKCVQKQHCTWFTYLMQNKISTCMATSTYCTYKNNYLNKRLKEKLLLLTVKLNFTINY